MDEFDYLVVAKFLSDNWAAFQKAAEKFGLNKVECEALLELLKRKGGLA